MSVLSLFQQDWIAHVGFAWECPICDEMTDPFEDSGICADCHYSED